MLITYISFSVSMLQSAIGFLFSLDISFEAVNIILLSSFKNAPPADVA
jgi:hypothetical protein